MGHDEYIKEFKYNRMKNQLKTFLSTLYFNDYGIDTGSHGYHDTYDTDYIFVSETTKYIIVSESLRGYGLEERDLFDIIKKFTCKENYKIVWEL